MEENILDHVYTIADSAYIHCTLSAPRAVRSWFPANVLMLPAHILLINKVIPTSNVFRVWPEVEVWQLQECFESANWNLFAKSNPTAAATICHTLTSDTVNVTIVKKIWVFPNKKPWVNAHVRKMLKSRDFASVYTLARANLKRGIKAQFQASDWGEVLTTKNRRRMWQGIRAIIDCKTGQVTHLLTAAPSLGEDLNMFFPVWHWRGGSLLDCHITIMGWEWALKRSDGHCTSWVGGMLPCSTVSWDECFNLSFSCTCCSSYALQICYQCNPSQAKTSEWPKRLTLHCPHDGDSEMLWGWYWTMSGFSSWISVCHSILSLPAD